MHQRERAAEAVRRQIEDRGVELGCVAGSGNLGLPGTPNWYIPGTAVVREDLARGRRTPPPPDTLVVEVTSESNTETDRVVESRRYAEYGAPPYLLVDRVEGSITLYSEPGRLGYARLDGPHPFGTAMYLPAPLELGLDATGRRTRGPRRGLRVRPGVRGQVTGTRCIREPPGKLRHPRASAPPPPLRPRSGHRTARSGPVRPAGPQMSASR
ncbi:Uma2 family endonuclease [Streptomyces sp. NPDC058195]|uniref:Uma2 family endonuclease n=1 Tax=Streptomyces sp. NPDC058195 TaxID=3346375 RepID=UPI0036EB73A8